MSSPRVRLTPLTGANRIGGGVWHLQQGRHGLLLDFGIDIGRATDFLGPRLRPRDNRGILDPLQIGLLPRYDGLYRSDLILQKDLLKNADDLNVEALLLTHLHADHAQQLYALDPAIGIHSTAATAAFALASTVTRNGLPSEATHIVPRQLHPTESGILLKPRGIQAIPREWQVHGGVPLPFREMWRAAGSDHGLGTSTSAAAGIPYIVHDVDHSIYGTCAYEFESQKGRIVYATDLRKHGRLAHKTEAFIEALERNRPDVLLLEGTRLGRESDIRTTERQAKSRIVALVEGAGNGLVVAILNPNNLERLSAFGAAAARSGRKLVVSATTMFTIKALEVALPAFDLGLDDLLVLDPPSTSRSAWHKDLRDRHERQLVSMDQIRRDPTRYVLATSSSRRNEWIDIKPTNGLLIYSNSAAYSGEAVADHEAIRLWAQMYRMRIEGLLPGGRVDPYLSPSGHLHESDIREILERVRPERLVPIHTDASESFRALCTSGTKVISAEDGRTIWV